MKRMVFKHVPFVERKEKFDLKYKELKQKQEEFARDFKQHKEELEALLKEHTAEAKKRAKKVAKRVKFDLKYAYVASGHVKNEVLGFLTVFNLGRSHKVRTKRLIRYDEKNNEMYLNIYQRKDRDMSKRARVFVYIHGGGWIGGRPATREAFTTQIAEEGYFVASIFYGDAPKYSHPEMIQNIYKAFKYLKDHAEEYNIDMDSIFVGGESAGGHLSAMAACIATNPEYNARFELDESVRHQRIEALVLNCGVYDMEKAVTTGFRNIGIYTQSYLKGTEVKDAPEKLRMEISPINWVTKDFPPTYAISAEHDNLAVLTFDLVDKLFDLGVYVDHYHGEGKWAVHAFAVSQGFKISKEAMRGAKEFLAEICNAEGCVSAVKA